MINTDTTLDNEREQRMGDHTRVSWPLDFDPRIGDTRIAAPSDEARSAAVGVLEDVSGAAGDGLGSTNGDERA